MSALPPDGDSVPSQDDPWKTVAPAIGCHIVPPAHEFADFLAQRGYQILEEVGRGGMGIVFKAHDARRNQVVALKTIQGRDASLLQRFKQEFRALCVLSHPNLANLYELISDGKIWFIAMEFIDGPDLLTHLRSGVRMEHENSGGEDSLSRLRKVFGQLAEGIMALHHDGKLHRDIKPSNVMVKPTGEVVLLDFGLTAELDAGGRHQSTEYRVLGTIAYMAPEQAAGSPVSPASDWYSVGVMLFEALTGRLPFTGSAFEVITQKQQSDAPMARALAAGVPDDLNALCARLLSRQPDRRPAGPEVVATLLGADARPHSHSHVWSQVSRPFVGRYDQKAKLASAFADVCEGRQTTLIVHGRSGIGKSALVSRFLDGIEANGAVILRGRCFEHESVPFKALDSLIDTLARYLRHLPETKVQGILPRDISLLARLFPVLRPVDDLVATTRRAEVPDPHELRRRAIAALRELFGRLGDRVRLVLFIDDLQWGDSDSGQLLAELLRPPAAPALLLLGCIRSDDTPKSSCLQVLFQAVERKELNLLEVDLEPLLRHEAISLAKEVLGPDFVLDVVEAIAKESEGNPYFIYELALRAKMLSPQQYGSAQEALTLDEALWGRIQGLPDEARRLLEVVAVSGRPIGKTHAIHAAGLHMTEERTSLSLMRSARLIRSTAHTEGEEIETFHDRIRETVVARLSPSALRRHHLKLGRVLEASGQFDPEVLAIHYLGANESGVAGEFFAKAASKADQALAFDQAAKLYRKALELGQSKDLAGRSLRVALADTLVNAGRGAEAANEYRVAALSASPGVAADLRKSAALQLLSSGYVDEGLATLEEVLTSVGMKLAPSPFWALVSLVTRRSQLWLRGLRFQIREEKVIPAEELQRIDLCWSVSIGLSMIDTIRGADFQTRSLLLALRAGEPMRIARALSAEAAFVSTSGVKTAEKVEKLLRLADDVAQVSPPFARAWVSLAKGAAAYLFDRWQESLDLCDFAASIFRENCTGVTWEMDTVNSFALWSLVWQGKLPELRQRWLVLLQGARERGDRYAETNLSTFIMSVIRLAADQPEEVSNTVDQVMKQWSQQGYHIQHHNALLARMLTALYCGEAEAAWEMVSANWPAFARSLLVRIQNLRWHMHFMRGYAAIAAAMVRVGEAEYLRNIAERDAKKLQAEGLPTARAMSKFILAAVANARGDSKTARDSLTEALLGFQAINMGIYAAATQRRLGELIGGKEGLALITGADAWMSGQGIRNPVRMTEAYAPGFST